LPSHDKDFVKGSQAAYADVVRRQPDGSWLFVIDNPNGSD
jgi:hypothetical protein